MLQTELFDQGPGAVLDVAPEALRWRDAASCLPARLRLGTSSWSFPGWAGAVYDREVPDTRLARQGLAAYARHPLFRTVGLDRSYYQPLSRAVYAQYAGQVPDDFRFLVKADRSLTTPGSADFLNVDATRQRVLDPLLLGMGVRLGVLLFQFPPLDASEVGGPDRFADRLATFFDGLKAPCPVAVELRTRALFGVSYSQVLKEHGIAHSYVAHPAMPTLEEQRALLPPEDASAPVTVIRWMLARGRTYEGARDAWRPFSRLQSPDVRTRQAVVSLIQAGNPRSGGDTFVIVNNKAEGSSPRSIEALVEALVGG
jgi:uncharacterized protein YecE (DUF72 family)